MKSVEFRLCAVGVLGALLSAGSMSGATNLISGDVTNHATWSGTNLLSGTVTIQTGVVVNIDPGTRMLMNAGATLRVYGQLFADGTSNAPIYFTRAAASGTWGRIMFVNAAASRLSHCVIEYANSAGDHKDYYPTNCSPPIFRPRNNYHEAVVALACHLDVEGCVFQNLPSASGQGDAIAIISDHPDPTNTNLWNSASATVRNCRFLDIGQGVHTRYAYVLVEGCYFYSHNGDNDDVDLYGESSPVPLVRSNMFLYAYDDFINPTRCSAVISDNVFVGTNDTDHGIVLRDVCRPIVMNNVLYRTRAGGIAVQNGCEGLIVNNTLVNCNNAIKMFDHQTPDRIGPPYCLATISGRATVINCLIWNSTPAFDLSGAAYGTLDTYVLYSDIQGGTNNASLGTKGRIFGGPGNINADPLFANAAMTNFHLSTGSPCIDAGTNPIVALTNLIIAVTNDYDGVPRPLDGNGDGLARYDMGAYEFLLATADSNSDGIPDGWCWSYGLNPLDPNTSAADANGDGIPNGWCWRYGFSPIDQNLAAGNPDSDPHTTFQEYVADTDPTNALSHFRIAAISTIPSVSVYFQSSSNRHYTLFCATNFVGSNAVDTIWTAVPGQVDVLGSGDLGALSDTNAAPQKFYRLGVKAP